MEDNAQVCAYVDGKVVLDLYGSYDLNRKHSNNYTACSIQNVFSSSKAVTSILMAMLVDKGYLNYSEPISELWADFAEHDKEDITLEDLMRHETGLQKFSFVLSARHHLHRHALKATTHVGKSIANSKKQPGHHSPIAKKSPSSVNAGNEVQPSVNELQHPADRSSIACRDMPIPAIEKRVKSRAYHAVTRGWIENEICMRADPQGRTLGELMRDWLSIPLGLEGELTLGSETVEFSDRISPLVKIQQGWLWAQVFRFFNRKVPFKSLFIALILNQVLRI